jgi:hypothetical protein
MKNISLWAWHHRGKARSAVVILNILLAALAVYVGRSLSSLSITIPSWSLLCGIGIFVSAAAAYPNGARIRYKRQKSCDLLIAAGTFLIICCLSNMDNPFGLTSPLASGSNPEKEWIKPGKPGPTAQEILSRGQANGKEHLTRQEKRILKKEMKRQLKAYVRAKVSGDKHTAAKALLIIASIAVALGLLYVLAAVACSISCSGSPGLAIFIFFTGFAAVIFGLIFLIRAILRWGKPKTLTGPNLNSSSSTP